MELTSRSLRQRGYHHRIPGAAPSHALSGAHTPIIVIRESGLTIIELELELSVGEPWICIAKENLCGPCK